MLLTLLKNGNIGKGDVIDALYESQEHAINMNNSIPKVTSRPGRNDYVITVPAKISPTGKRFQITGKTEEEAIQKYKSKVAIDSGIPSLADYMFQVLVLHYYQNVANSTFDKYEGIYSSIIRDSHMGEMDINKVDSRTLTEFFKTLTSGRYAKGTPMITKSILNQVFQYAKHDKWIDENPMEFATISLKNCKSPKKYFENFTLDEMQCIEQKIVDSWDSNKQEEHRNLRKQLYFFSPMFMVMCFSGLRIGEMLGLRLCDVDEEKRVIHVRNQIVGRYKRTEDAKRNGKIAEDAEPKTESSIRDTVLTDGALYWLNELKNRQKQRGFSLDVNSYFVVNTKGKHPTKDNVYAVWGRLLADAKIEYRPPHKLRKTFVSYCITYGGDEISLPDVSAMVGHKKTTTTVNDYFKSIQRHDKRDKAKIISGIFEYKSRREVVNSLSTVVNSSGGKIDAQKKRRAL